MFFNKEFLIFPVPIFFLLIGIKTIPDYGINWDEPQHFNRGQAYLHYFLTGKTNFLELPPNESLDESVDFKDIRGNYSDVYLKAKKNSITFNEHKKRSYYQSDVFNFEYFIKNDSGHPPANGILAALSNKILFQQLGIMKDLDSYHFFEVFCAFLIVLGVGLFSYYLFGIFPAIVASSSLALYPLFFSESHFNIKDPVLASFFGLTILFFYFGVIKKRKLFILISSIFAGLSLGTKFNTLFLPLIIFPWLFLYWWRSENLKIVYKTAIIYIIYPFIAFGVFYLLWPYLWFNGWEGLLSIFKYYQYEGIGQTELLSGYKFLGLNLFPLFWIFITTPIPILVLSLVGIFSLSKKIKKDSDQASLLILLWLFIPILRVSIPNTVVYGGIRQIMEFVPALAIASGAGTKFLLSSINKQYRNFAAVLIFLSLVFVLAEIVKIHPNENVYFNQLIGGLEGAVFKNIPYSGNSFGNAYQQGILWLNKNAEIGANLGLPIGGTVNLPRENLRKDINLSNDNFSAFLMEGEYEMEMSHNGAVKDLFSYKYLENFLKPAYEVKVDNISILKIWKNDPKYLKKTLSGEINFALNNLRSEGGALEIDIGKIIYLTGVYIDFKEIDCINSSDGFITTSEDGLTWIRESETLSYPQISPSKIKSEKKDFFFLFAGEKARFIRINLDNKNSCLFNNPVVEVKGFFEKPF